MSVILCVTPDINTRVRLNISRWRVFTSHSRVRSAVPMTTTTYKSPHLAHGLGWPELSLIDFLLYKYKREKFLLQARVMKKVLTNGEASKELSSAHDLCCGTSLHVPLQLHLQLPCFTEVRESSLAPGCTTHSNKSCSTSFFFSIPFYHLILHPLPHFSLLLLPLVFLLFSLPSSINSFPVSESWI
jgi:hypothetical protein